MEKLPQGQVKVIEKNTLEVLFSCSYQDAKKAYIYAAEMEDLGLDVEVIHPGASESLADTLGVDSIKNLKDSMQFEIDSH